MPIASSETCGFGLSMHPLSIVEHCLRKARRLGQTLGWGRCIGEEEPSSSGYAVVDPALSGDPADGGWHVHSVAARQDLAYRGLLRQMYAGTARLDFEACAEAVRTTGLTDPLILEVGCGSGYYSEILSYLLGYKVRYAGLDYSRAVVRIGVERYPGQLFIQGSATHLPFPNDLFDVVLNGVSLMHIPEYKAAIREAHRVSRQWCIFHTVPVLRESNTVTLRKIAYGQPVIEVVFNEAELRSLLAQSGLVVNRVLESIPYDLVNVLGEHTTTKTLVCQVSARCAT